MDPNENLKQQQALAHAILDADTNVDTTFDAWRLAELVQALDEWITSGGFTPAEWRDK